MSSRRDDDRKKRKPREPASAKPDLGEEGITKAKRSSQRRKKRSRDFNHVMEDDFEARLQSDNTNAQQAYIEPVKVNNQVHEAPRPPAHHNPPPRAPVAVNVRNIPPKQEYTPDCKSSCKYCGLGCCMLALLIVCVGAAVLILNFQEPQVSIKRAFLTDVKVTLSDVVFTTEVQVRLQNPNKAFVKVTAEDIKADFWLLDVANTDAKPIHVGSASIKDPVIVEAESDEKIDVSASGHAPLSGDAGILLLRVLRDCGTTQSVKLRATFSTTLAAVAFVDVHARGIEVTVEPLVECRAAP